MTFPSPIPDDPESTPYSQTIAFPNHPSPFQIIHPFSKSSIPFPNHHPLPPAPETPHASETPQPNDHTQ